MGIGSLLVISLGLATDASAVAISLGLKSCRESRSETALKSGLYFGFFQGLMPLIGWILGKGFSSYIEGIDHWIAFTVLAILGGKLIVDSFKEDEELGCITCFSRKLYLSLAVATSIDALALGITLAFLQVNILWAAVMIGLVTFTMSFSAVILGEKLGNLVKEKATILGGVLLIVIACKILLEHLGLDEVLLNFFINK